MLGLFSLNSIIICCLIILIQIKCSWSKMVITIPESFQIANLNNPNDTVNGIYQWKNKNDLQSRATTIPCVERSILEQCWGITKIQKPHFIRHYGTDSQYITSSSNLYILRMLRGGANVYAWALLTSSGQPIHGESKYPYIFIDNTKQLVIIGNGTTPVAATHNLDMIQPHSVSSITAIKDYLHKWLDLDQTHAVDTNLKRLNEYRPDGYVLHCVPKSAAEMEECNSLNGVYSKVNGVDHEGNQLLKEGGAYYNKLKDKWSVTILHVNGVTRYKNRQGHYLLLTSMKDTIDNYRWAVTDRRERMIYKATSSDILVVDDEFAWIVIHPSTLENKGMQQLLQETIRIKKEQENLLRNAGVIMHGEAYPIWILQVLSVFSTGFVLIVCFVIMRGMSNCMCEWEDDDDGVNLGVVKPPTTHPGSNIVSRGSVGVSVFQNNYNVKASVPHQRYNLEGDPHGERNSNPNQRQYNMHSIANAVRK
eukprot:642208_1